VDCCNNEFNKQRVPLESSSSYCLLILVSPKILCSTIKVPGFIIILNCIRLPSLHADTDVAKINRIEIC